MMQVSEKRREAARANGARSHGPVTPEGKAISAQNSFKHGILARQLLLPHEDREAFEELAQSYFDRFQPVDEVERGIVEEMISAYWRLRRVTASEMGVLREGMVSHPGTSQFESLALTFADSASHPKLNLLLRYQARFSLMHSRCLRDLAALRKNLPAPKTVPNEPKTSSVCNTASPPEAPVAAPPVAPRVAHPLRTTPAIEHRDTPSPAAFDQRSVQPRIPDPDPCP